MALTIQNSDASTPVIPSIPGAQKVAAIKVTFDSSYPTGGEVISAADVGLLQIDSIICNAATTVGRIVAPVLASGVWKLKVFSALSTEVANTTDLSADSVHILVIGK